MSKPKIDVSHMWKTEDVIRKEKEDRIREEKANQQSIEDYYRGNWDNIVGMRGGSKIKRKSSKRKSSKRKSSKRKSSKRKRMSSKIKRGRRGSRTRRL
jgi:hypothetical protein